MSFDHEFADRFMVSGPPLNTFADMDEVEMRISPGMPNFPPDIIPDGYPEFTQPRLFLIPELEYLNKKKMPPSLLIGEANEEAYQARLELFRIRLVNKAMAAPITPPNLMDMPRDLDSLPDNNPQYGEIPSIHLPFGYEEALKSALRFPKGKVPQSVYDNSPYSSSVSASPVTPSSEKKKVRFNMPAPPPPSPQSANTSPSRIPVPVSKGRRDSRARESKKAAAAAAAVDQVRTSSTRKGGRAEASSPYRRTSEGSGSSRSAERSSTKKGSSRKSL